MRIVKSGMYLSRGCDFFVNASAVRKPDGIGMGCSSVEGLDSGEPDGMGDLGDLCMQVSDMHSLK